MALSDKDRQVLDSIFNPLQLGGGAELDSWMIPVHDDKNDLDQSSEKTELSESERKALQLEADAILLAEKEDYKRSLELFSEAIALYPTRPNSYNNRAQVYRLLDAGDGLDELALADLTKALSLCQSKGNTAKNAFCQRGLIYRKTNEDLAREDFKQAVSLGSDFARNQLVELNPYAALCNQMLQEAFMKMN